MAESRNPRFNAQRISQNIRKAIQRVSATLVSTAAIDYQDENGHADHIL
jgi:hypothetical protein